MLRKVTRAMFRDVGHGNDRAQGFPSVDPLGKPPILRRQTLNLLAVLVIGGILYGALLPFQIDPAKSFSWNLPWQGPAYGDTVPNVLIYIPIGAFLRLLFRRRGSSWVSECSWTLLVAGALSYLTEVSQTVIAHRYPGWLDTICNFSGAVVGMVLAPVFQRILRNLHAWMYFRLHSKPFAVAVTAAVICIWVHALAPFDLHPTASHMSTALETLWAKPVGWSWFSAIGGPAELSSLQIVDKLVAAGSYGLLAFLSILAIREAGQTLLAASWHAFTRVVALAAGIELIQLFTISHIADPRDLLSAWLCAFIGTGAGFIVVTQRPRIHQQPMVVLRGILATVMMVLLAWAGASAMLKGGKGAAETTSWLPVFVNFHRPWSSVIGDYTSGFLQYTIVAIFLALRCRSHGGCPSKPLILGGALAGAVFLTITHAAFRNCAIDSTQFILALLAGAAVLGLDRALFSKRRPRPAALPSPDR